MLEPLFIGPESQRPLPVRRRPQSRKPGSTARKSSVTDHGTWAGCLHAEARKFEFVSSGAAGKPAPETRKFIRSYVMRGKNRKHTSIDQNRSVSWLNHDLPSYRGGYLVTPADDDAEQNEEPSPLADDIIAIVAPSFPGPLRPPSDLTLFNFAQPLSPSSRKLIIRCKLPRGYYSSPTVDPCSLYDHQAIPLSCRAMF